MPSRRRHDAEPNTHGLPTGEPLRRALARAFREQREKVLRWLATGRKSAAGDGLPPEFPPLDDFGLGALDLAGRMTPLITLTWESAAAKFAPKVGLDPNAWTVINPHTERMIREAAFAFCSTTNATTSKSLNKALADLRAELIAGVVERGETLTQLTRRVEMIFDGAESWRARSIAQTETSRAVHAAQEQAAIASGVVTGWEWLLSEDACPLCQTVARRARFVRLGQAFATDSKAPAAYKDVKFAPLHPHCNCTVVPVLDTDPQPEWAATLHDPHPGPEDKPEPKPRPRKPKPAPAAKPKPGVRPKPAEKPMPAAPVRAVEKPMDKIRREIAEAWEEQVAANGGSHVIAPELPIAERIKLYKVGDLKIAALTTRLESLTADVTRQLSDAIVARDAASDRLKRLEQAVKAAKAGGDARAARKADKEADAAVKTLEQAEKRVASLAESRSRRTMEALHLDPAVRLDIGYSAVRPGTERGGVVFRPPTPRNRAALDESLAWLSRITRKGAPGSSFEKAMSLKVGESPGQRAYQATDLSSPIHVAINVNEAKSVIIHEYGHAIDLRIAEGGRSVGQRTKEFLSYRVGDEKPTPMRDIAPDAGYDAHEMGRGDHFERATGSRNVAFYAGKEYPGKTSSEILSIGVELLYRDPAKFARDDPEWCKYVLGALDGSLR